MGLHFKGEKTKKKSKSSKARSHGASTVHDDPDAHLEGWIPAPSAALLLGPSYLTLPATDLTPAVCVAVNPTTGKVHPFALPSSSASASTSRSAAGPASALASSSKDLAHLDAEELEALVDASSDPALIALQEENPEPSDVHRVWVCARIPDTNDKVTFRSGSGKFLASDELGRVTADREARGMQEEWTLEPVATAGENSNSTAAAGGRLVIKNAYGKYLSVDVVAGGKLELRADETQEGATERWKVMMQGEFVVKAKKQYNERNGIKTKPQAGYTVVTDLAGAEVDAISKYHHHATGADAVQTPEAARALKKARKEGKLAEAMLDRRMKLKSDRYC
ncbi:hypothetical protein JCM3774_004840 [Rhodotorula dairenensis]